MQLTTGHGETIHVAVGYSGEMDGMSYTIGVGTINGNSQAKQTSKLLLKVLIMI